MNQIDTIASTATRATGLGAELDQIIERLPVSIFGAGDEDIAPLDLQRNPYPILRALVDRAGPVVRAGADGTFSGVTIPDPIGADPRYPRFVALSHAAMHEVATSPDRFQNARAYLSPEDIQGKTINTYDGVDHRNRRRLMDQSMFGPKQMREYLVTLVEPNARYLVDRIARRFEEGKPVDLCRDLAMPLVYKGISTIIGLPENLFESFVLLGDDAFAFNSDPERALAAVETMDKHFRQELAAHQAAEAPPRDMMTILSQADYNGFRFDDDEIVRHCRFLLPGGIETTWRATANLFMAMLLHPEQWTAVTRDPKLVDQAVEEALRWAPSGWNVPRVAAQDTELAGVEIPAGSNILGLQGFANRDPKVWERPDEFDIFRPLKPHLTFHAGPHFCMGQNLARHNLRTALREMAIKLPGLRLACAPEDVEMCGFTVRVVKALPVELG